MEFWRHWLSTSIFLTVLVSSKIRRTDGQGYCNLLTSCSCRFDNGQIIDLSPLANTDGKPRFANVSDPIQNFVFSWNPCENFTQAECADVAVCQVVLLLPEDVVYDAGDQRNAEFIVTGAGRLNLQYTALGKDQILRTSNVELICDENVEADFRVLGETKHAHYEFSLTSAYACPNGTIIPHTEPPSTQEPTGTTHSLPKTTTANLSGEVKTLKIIGIISLTCEPLIKITEDNDVLAFEPTTCTLVKSKNLSLESYFTQPRSSEMSMIKVYMLFCVCIENMCTSNTMQHWNLRLANLVLVIGLLCTFCYFRRKRTPQEAPLLERVN